MRLWIFRHTVPSLLACFIYNGKTGETAKFSLPIFTLQFFSERDGMMEHNFGACLYTIWLS